MESEKLKLTVVYRYWYKVWMDDSESWVYKDGFEELDVCCCEYEVYDKVQEHLRATVFAYPAIGLGFKFIEVNKRDDDPITYRVSTICYCERDGSVEEWDEVVKVHSMKDDIDKLVKEYMNDYIKTADMQNFEWIIEKVENLK